MRIRSIKPEFWRSDDIAQLTPEVRLLFIGIWSYVDDNGVGIDDYRQITADLFALDNDPEASRAYVREGLARLSEGNLIIRYGHAGKRYLYVASWDRHQRVDKPNKARYPRPDADGVSVCESLTSENADMQDHRGRPSATPSRNPRETPAPGTGEQGNRGTGEQQQKTSSSVGPRKRGSRIPDDFTVTPQMVAWARDRVPDVDGRLETEKFINHWRAASGARAVKVDWAATWRNWMLNANERRPRQAPTGGLVERNGLHVRPETAERLDSRARLAALDAARETQQLALGDAS